MRPILTLLSVFVIPATAAAGLHISTESFRELPADWRGFLPDHRALRLAAVSQFSTLPATPLRDTFADAALKLETAARSRPLTADELADLGGLYVRLGQPAKAVELLRPAARQHPDHFRLAANLGTAWQAIGELDSAAASLEDAVRLAPEPLKDAERYHLKLVRLRNQEKVAGKDASAPDDLFGIRYFDATPGKFPDSAPAMAQRLALWLPTDGRLLWQLGEIANRSGDVRTAANILDGCVTEFGMKSPAVRARRQELRATADAWEKKVGHQATKGTIVFRSSRPLLRSFDPARLPAVKPDGVNPLPWPALTETTVGKGFKPAYLKYVEQLDGKRVSVGGFALPAGDPGTFLLTEYPVGCWFCEAPGPTQVLSVEPAGELMEIPRGAVRVTGILKLNRTDPERLLFTVTNAATVAAD